MLKSMCESCSFRTIWDLKQGGSELDLGTKGTSWRFGADWPALYESPDVLSLQGR
jgi:hypothetical protein